MKKEVIKKMLSEYTSRLDSVLAEDIEAFDEEGNKVISKDLKVVHVGSGFEYTVDNVTGVNGNALVTLRRPEVPRDSAINKEELHPDFSQEHGENEIEDQKNDVSLDSEEYFTVTQQDFEKNYQGA